MENLEELGPAAFRDVELALDLVRTGDDTAEETLPHFQASIRTEDDLAPFRNRLIQGLALCILLLCPPQGFNGDGEVFGEGRGDPFGEDAE